MVRTQMPLRSSGLGQGCRADARGVKSDMILVRQLRCSRRFVPKQTYLGISKHERKA